MIFHITLSSCQLLVQLYIDISTRFQSVTFYSALIFFEGGGGLSQLIMKHIILCLLCLSPMLTVKIHWSTLCMTLVAKDGKQC